MQSAQYRLAMDNGDAVLEDMNGAAAMRPSSHEYGPQPIRLPTRAIDAFRI